MWVVQQLKIHPQENPKLLNLLRTVALPATACGRAARGSVLPEGTPDGGSCQCVMKLPPAVPEFPEGILTVSRITESLLVFLNGDF